MPKKVPAPTPSPGDDGTDRSHTWIVASNIPVDLKTARHANLRLRFYATEGMLVEALEVLCSACRRPLDAVELQPCEARVNNEHLIGGDQSVRAKRKKFPAPVGAVRVPGERITRRGIEAYVAGGAIATSQRQ